jgi:hypothetical protein
MNVLLQKYQGTIHLDQLKMYMVFVATVLTKINKLQKINKYEKVSNTKKRQNYPKYM